MNSAKMKESILSLAQLPQQEFQRIYEESLKEAVICRCCEKPVKLYLGINHPPYFYHSNQKLNEACQKQFKVDFPVQLEPAVEVKTTENFSEQNGFRIPKSRSIATVDKPEENEWREPKTLKGRSPFVIKVKAPTSLLGIPLDMEQKEAVTTTEGPLLILAGAGSGKTRVLTTRALYMIEEKKISPTSMMLVTFTAKAAKEMQQRLLANSSIQASKLNQLVIGTFHSIFYKILLHHDREK